MFTLFAIAWPVVDVPGGRGMMTTSPREEGPGVLPPGEEDPPPGPAEASGAAARDDDDDARA
jgi:hypothetical protein